MEFLTPVLAGNETISEAQLAAFALEQGRVAETELLATAAAEASHQIKLRLLTLCSLRFYLRQQIGLS